MAIWQFDCYIIPKNNVITNVCLDCDDILSWGMQNRDIENIDFLEKQKSWSSKISQYGKEDETCIEFFYEKDFLMEIHCRFDLRSLSKKMLQNILDYVKKNEGMIFCDGRIYSPDINEIIKLMKNSKANKFCQNPMNLFEELSMKS